ncbi:Flagellar hook-basal body complex protein FliE [Paraconexibacter sp. AEG42_29]|uniref:Flagellar hook-basal body complex protein FliE n=1 Tax=Paraconexibacter sp. AEG42_29 TaxID=2997339 RepID=A0AAU7ANM1_9ACTN
MPLVPGIGAAAPSAGLGGISGLGGSEWQIDGIGGVAGAEAPAKSFGSMLGDQLGALDKLQNTAAEASQALADGTATDATTAVMAVERAKLSMQMAAQLRTKGVEALNDIFHTTV